MDIYTAQYNYSGKDRMDVTVKSGNSNFAPTWEMVMGYKNGTISEEQYTEMYLKILAKVPLDVFQDLEVWGDHTFVCFCRKGDFCHRVLLAQYIEKLGLGVYKGER